MTAEPSLPRASNAAAEKPRTPEANAGAVSTALSRGPVASFPELAARYCEEYQEKILRAIDGLDTESLWWRATTGSSSIGNQIVHLDGNLRLWIEGALGGVARARDRAGEFAADRSHDGPQLRALLERVVTEVTRTLRAEDLGRLDEGITVQGYAVDRRGVIFHAIEHLSYHTGQIVLLAKQLRGADSFEFYPHHAGE